MAEEVGAVKAKVGLDTVEFNEGMGKLATKMKILGEEFKNASSGLDKVGDASKIAELKAKSLSDGIELQQKIVDKLTLAYDKSGGATAANTKKALDYELKLKKAEGTLQSMQQELTKATQDLENQGKETGQATDKVDKFSKEADNAANKTNKWGDQLKALGSHMGSGFATIAKGAAVGIAAMGTAALTAGAALGKMISSSIENADSIQKSADIYGLSAERVQELTYAGTKLDVELDTITGAQTKLTKAMAAAETGKNGPNAQAEAFGRLGIKVRDSSGQLRDSKTVMSEAFTALGKMGNETERDAMALVLFGKSAMELNPLIKAGGDELNRLSEEARTSGAVLSNAAIEGLDAFGDSAEALKLSVKGVAGTLAASLLPAMGGVLTFAQGIVPELQKAVTTGDFGSLGVMIGDGITKAVTGISMGLEKFMPVVTSILTSLATTIVTVLPTIAPVLLNAAMQLVQGLLDVITANIDPLAAMAVTLVTSIAGFIVTNLPLVVDTGIKILIAIMDGIASTLPQLTPQVVAMVLQINQTIIDNLPTIITAAIQIIMSVIAGIVDTLPQLIPQIVDMIMLITNTILMHLPEIIKAAIQIILAVVQGISDALPRLIPQIVDAIILICVAIIDNLPLIITASIQIIMAVIQGLIQAIPQLIAEIPRIATAIINEFGYINWGSIGTTVIDGIGGTISGLAGKAWAWGRDFIGGLVDGINSAVRRVTDTVSGIADSIKNFLGFSVPEEGALSEYESWMPDFMGGLASGIAKNKHLVTAAINGLSANMRIGVDTNIASGNSGLTSGSRGVADSIVSRAAPTYILNFTGPLTVRSDDDIRKLSERFQRDTSRMSLAVGGAG